ncbi:hypothetical protein A8B77_13045 [Erythrobacter sp. EhN03]|uniref:hypothetical protein n=1 Tax=Qipengyuania flava TaxID=192812 RepID=UPI0007F505E8|nr:hypothetical protein A8B77_13045 [Erythrobacter sp. EhN03]
MQIIRIILWVFFGALGIILVTLNWGEPQPFRIMPGTNGDDRLFEWPVGFIGLFFFLLGFLPMWALHHLQKWRWRRRINSLEAATKRMASVDRPRAAAKPPTTDTDLPPEPANPVEPEPSKPA